MRRFFALSVVAAAAAFAAAPVFAPLAPSSPPSGRRSSGAALEPGLTDSMLIFGGFASGGGVSDLHVWRGLTNAWSLLPSTLPARERHGLAYDPGSDRYVIFGGVNGLTVMDTAYLVDGQTLAWWARARRR